MTDIIGRMIVYSIGVFVGVTVAMIMFVRRVAHFTEVIDVAHPDDDTRVYAVIGELFFASTNDLVTQIDYVGDPRNVVTDLSDSRIWDASPVAILDAIQTKYKAKGKAVTIVGLNDASAERQGASLPHGSRALTPRVKVLAAMNSIRLHEGESR